MTLTNGSSVGSLGESYDSSTVSYDTCTVAAESLDNDKETKSLLERPPAEKEKLKTHSRNTSIASPVVRYDKLQADEVKDVLLCLLYVLKHADEQALVCFWHHATQHDLICFFHILE